VRGDKRRGRGAAPAVIEASSRVQGPSLATVALEGKTYTVTPEESHARFLTIAAAVSQGAERLAHVNAVDRASAARGDSTTMRSAGAAPPSPVRSMSPRSDLGAEPHAQSAGATAEVGPAWRLPVKQRLNTREPQSR